MAPSSLLIRRIVLPFLLFVSKIWHFISLDMLDYEISNTNERDVVKCRIQTKTCFLKLSTTTNTYIYWVLPIIMWPFRLRISSNLFWMVIFYTIFSSKFFEFFLVIFWHWYQFHKLNETVISFCCGRLYENDNAILIFAHSNMSCLDMRFLYKEKKI